MAVFLCGHELSVHFHWSKREQSALVSAIVVVINVIRYGLYQFLAAGELSNVIFFTFDDAPEALHRAVIDCIGQLSEYSGSLSPLQSGKWFHGFRLTVPYIPALGFSIESCRISTCTLCNIFYKRSQNDPVS